LGVIWGLFGGYLGVIWGLFGGDLGVIGIFVVGRRECVLGMMMMRMHG